MRAAGERDGAGWTAAVPVPEPAGSPRGLPEREVLGGVGGREVCAQAPTPPRSDKNAVSVAHGKKSQNQTQTNFPRTCRRSPQKSRSAAEFKTAHDTRGGEECEQCPERKSELCLSVCLSASLSLSPWHRQRCA